MGVDGIKRVNKTIEHTNKTIQPGIDLSNGKELESINVTRMCNNEENKHKETLSMYNNEGKKNTLSKSEEKDKTVDSYVSMYECVKPFVIKRTNMNAQQLIYPPLRWKSLLKSTNII